MESFLSLISIPDKVGNEIVEATMCKRSRSFEFRAYRPLIRQYFDNDPRMTWTAAPKPMMSAQLGQKRFQITAREP